MTLGLRALSISHMLGFNTEEMISGLFCDMLPENVTSCVTTGKKDGIFNDNAFLLSFN
jgi:hypothetical protein